MAMNKRYMVTMKRSCSCSMPGVWGAVAHSEGAVVIFHSPKACAHVTRLMELGSHYHSFSREMFISKQYTAPLITSNLKEEHSIFGGADRLCQCIGYVVKRYNPKYIMIANSCVGGVIGDDIRAVADDAEQEWGIPVMAVPCNGFLDGEYYAGFYYAAKILTERLMDKQHTIAGAVTLLGGHGGPSGVDTQEIKRLLDFLGLRVHCHFPRYASLEEIRHVPASAICIPLGGVRMQSSFSMRQLAVDIENRFGVPFLDHDYPIGWRGIKSWLRKLGEKLGREREAETAIIEHNLWLQQQIYKYRDYSKTLKAVICIGRPLGHFQPEWVIELMDLAGVEIKGFLLFSGLTAEQKAAMHQELKKHTVTPVFEEEDENIIKSADILVTTHEIDDTAKRQFFLPVLPPLGAGGMVRLLHKLVRLVRRSERKGIMIHGW